MSPLSICSLHKQSSRWQSRCQSFTRFQIRVATLGTSGLTATPGPSPPEKQLGQIAAERFPSSQIDVERDHVVKVPQMRDKHDNVDVNAHLHTQQKKHDRIGYVAEEIDGGKGEQKSAIALVEHGLVSDRVDQNDVEDEGEEAGHTVADDAEAKVDECVDVRELFVDGGVDFALGVRDRGRVVVGCLQICVCGLFFC